MSLADAIAGAFAALQNAAGVTVTLRRGDKETEDVVAVPGRMQTLRVEDDGSTTNVRTRDFLIAVDDYAFDELRTDPRSGDRIVETTANGALVWELKPTAGEPAARHMDEATRGQHRCHVQLVEEQIEGVLGDGGAGFLATEDGTPLGTEG